MTAGQLPSIHNACFFDWEASRCTACNHIKHNENLAASSSNVFQCMLFCVLPLLHQDHRLQSCCIFAWASVVRQHVCHISSIVSGCTSRSIPAISRSVGKQRHVNTLRRVPNTACCYDRISGLAHQKRMNLLYPHHWTALALHRPNSDAHYALLTRRRLSSIGDQSDLSTLSETI